MAGHQQQPQSITRDTQTYHVEMQQKYGKKSECPRSLKYGVPCQLYESHAGFFSGYFYFLAGFEKARKKRETNIQQHETFVATMQ
jgi:hypothetical protein